MDQQIKAKPRETELGTIVPGFSDTLNGKKISQSSFAMGMHAGEITIKRDGKKHNITIIHNLGASLSLSSGKRSFNLNLEKVVMHAVENGLLDETIDFTQAA